MVSGHEFLQSVILIEHFLIEQNFSWRRRFDEHASLFWMPQNVMMTTDLIFKEFKLCRSITIRSDHLFTSEVATRKPYFMGAFIFTQLVNLVGALFTRMNVVSINLDDPVYHSECMRGFVDYRIVTKLEDGNCYIVRKRYNNFVALQSELCKLPILTPELPYPISILGSGFNTNY